MIIRDRQFYRTFFSLSLFLILQNVVLLSVNLTDNVMLGAYSELSLAGAATVNQLQFLLQMLIVGVADGLVVIAAQYWGQNRIEPVRELSAIAAWAALAISLAMLLIVSVAPRGVLMLFTTDPVILDEGVKYLSIVRWTYGFFALSCVLLATLRTVKIVRIAFYISMLTLAVNFGINYVLIFGHFGFPRLGVEGAAIGTLISRIIEFAAVVAYIAFFEKTLQLRLSDYFRRNRELLRDYIRVSVPIIINCGLWGASTGLQTAILGHMNANAIAANSIAVSLALLLKVGVIGAASSAAVMTGTVVGTGDMTKIRDYTQTFQLLFCICGVVIGALFFLLREPFLGFYSLTPETHYLANAFLIVMSIAIVGTAYQMPSLCGIVRGGGDTRFVMYNDLVCIWGIVLPLSFAAAFWWSCGPIVVIALLNSDQIFKCLVAAIKVNRYTWIKQLTRA